MPNNNTRRRAAEYKPLLFTTTVRNPERIKWFLNILKDFNGHTLTNDLSKTIVGELIRAGLYEPTNLSTQVKEKIKNGESLTDGEVKKVLDENPQDHKEAGFDRGWPSRFDTLFKISKELGFVYYEIGKKIAFSKIGLMFADNEHPEFEQQAFLNAFAKYQSNNPFRRVLNEYVPLVLLLSVIKKLNGDSEYHDTGISRLEIPILLCWRDNDSDKLYLKIKEIRKKYGYEPSWETILRVCDELTGGRHNHQQDKTIMQDLPDEFLRKMRLTGLIAIRGFGRFIDHNKNEIDKINHVIKNYSVYKKYEYERNYFDYLSHIDSALISTKTRKISAEEENKLLSKWGVHYSWEEIKEELLGLGAGSSSRDEILKLIPAPLRLEFLSSLAILAKYPNIKMIPNYIADDEGLPSSHAPGNKADIECYEEKNCTLLELTLLNGAVQVVREMTPITRHLMEKQSMTEATVTFFIAPKIHEDTLIWRDFLIYRDKLSVIPLSIVEFIEYLEQNNPILYRTS